MRGISHITLIVRDLERATDFLQTVFDARMVYDSGEETFSLSKERFFLAGGLWLCIMEGEPHAGRTYDHIAFSVDEADFDTYLERLRQAGVEIRPPRARVQGEGRSVYFYDFDNHLFELHAGTLEERLARYETRRNAQKED